MPLLGSANSAASANSADPDQTMQNAVFDQGLHSYPLIQQIFDTSA